MEDKKKILLVDDEESITRTLALSRPQGWV